MHLPKKIFCSLTLLVTVTTLLYVYTDMADSLDGHILGRVFLLRGDDAEELERLVREDEARLRSHLGGGGGAAYLQDEEEQRLGEQSVRADGLNVYLSDRMPYFRNIRDIRHPDCEAVQYDTDLPSVSVIITFYEEFYSVLLRTVHSVLHTMCQRNDTDNSTSEASCRYGPLREVILVDDHSSRRDLRGKLLHYVSTRIPSGVVRVIRMTEHKGVTGARMAGARNATGEVLVFLDSHAEPTAGWLPPLLLRLKHSATTVAVPIIHNIGHKYFEYKPFPFYDFPGGGFSFDGHVQCVAVPEYERRRRAHHLAPTRTATMVGGIFAINRDYFWEVGGYDEAMEELGGENLEMSFRVWMCGGTLEVIPCSCVGHLERTTLPYTTHGDPHGINTARMAEVWMDDYKEIFYLHRPELRHHPGVGDVSSRQALRARLQCRDFQWYLTHVAPEMIVPIRDTVAFGRFQVRLDPGPESLCLHEVAAVSQAATLPLRPCEDQLSAQQTYFLTVEGVLMKNDFLCVKVINRSENEMPFHRMGSEGVMVVLSNCSDTAESQIWELKPSGQLVHVRSGLCLAGARRAGGGGGAALAACGGGPGQLWRVDYTQYNTYGPPDPVRDAALQRIKDSRKFYTFLRYVDDDPPGTVAHAPPSLSAPAARDNVTAAASAAGSSPQQPYNVSRR